MAARRTRAIGSRSRLRTVRVSAPPRPAPLPLSACASAATPVGRPTRGVAENAGYVPRPGGGLGQAWTPPRGWRTGWPSSSSSSGARTPRCVQHRPTPTDGGGAIAAPSPWALGDGCDGRVSTTMHACRRLWRSGGWQRLARRSTCCKVASTPSWRPGDWLTVPGQPQAQRTISGPLAAPSGQ
eukprot:COSAG01_NODE_1029_length_12019_cov_560.144631_8_plen_183_part_00